jgi:hypothetical protein
MRASLSDRGLHVAAATGLAMVVALGVAVAFYSKSAWGDDDEDDGPSERDLEAIEATLAYKKAEKPPTQPQKIKQPPPPEVKPEGVSHDDKAEPVKDPEPDKPLAVPDDNPDVTEGPATLPDDDEETGPTAKPDGEVDGSDIGFASTSRGPKYFQQMNAELRAGWEFPTILEGKGVPEACIRIEPDGKVQTKLDKRSGDADLDRSVEAALETFEKLRNSDPQKVPDDLLDFTERWICNIPFKL